MSVFLHKNSRVIIQGFTEQQATLHAEEAIKIGTNIVGGVVPGKGGTQHLGLPVFNTVEEAVQATGADISGIFVPPSLAADAIMEAIKAGIKTVVAITDNISEQDMMNVARCKAGTGSIVLGPNTHGIITPGAGKVGTMPSHIYSPGRVGIISRSGALDQEAAAQMKEVGLGQSTSVGIGGDPLNGTDFITVLKVFDEDPDTDAVLMIGEIDGRQENEVAQWVMDNMRKPLIGYFTDLTNADTASARLDKMEELGIYVVRNPADMGATVLSVISMCVC